MPTHELKFTFEIEKELASGTLRQASAAYHYTYIGEYGSALQTYELHPEANWGFDTISLSNPERWKLIDAIPYLTEIAKDRKLIIISEAHHKPQHRVFTRLLLDSLSKYGFNHLGLEALNHLDTLINERGYPLNSPISGTYVREPQMSNLIVNAHTLGFKLFPIDYGNPEAERDSQMARNVIRYMRNHPNEKVIVHCGWHHAVESDYHKRKRDHWMAYLIKMQSGIDPLTIYQDILSEKYLEPECPIYHQLGSETISVLVDRENIAYDGPSGFKHVDIQIYHPRTRFIQGRPDWLFSDERIRQVPVPKHKITLTYPIICRALHQSAAKDGVPADIVEIRSRYINKVLALVPGEYLLDIYNTLGQHQQFELQVED